MRKNRPFPLHHSELLRPLTDFVPKISSGSSDVTRSLRWLRCRTTTPVEGTELRLAVGRVAVVCSSLVFGNGQNNSVWVDCQCIRIPTWVLGTPAREPILISCAKKMVDWLDLLRVSKQYSNLGGWFAHVCSPSECVSPPCLHVSSRLVVASTSWEMGVGASD